MALLGLVLFFGLVVTIIVAGYHFLWRGGSRTLFSVQERRQLINLGRSSLAESYFELQNSFDISNKDWFDWCTWEGLSPQKTFEPILTKDQAARMTNDPEYLRYSTSEVRVKRVQRLDPRGGEGAALGLVDLEVTVQVYRHKPRHEARLTMVERRTFRLSDATGPFYAGGRHVALSPTPMATVIKDG